MFADANGTVLPLGNVTYTDVTHDDGTVTRTAVTSLTARIWMRLQTFTCVVNHTYTDYFNEVDTVMDMNGR